MLVVRRRFVAQCSVQASCSVCTSRCKPIANGSFAANSFQKQHTSRIYSTEQCSTDNINTSL